MNNPLLKLPIPVKTLRILLKAILLFVVFNNAFVLVSDSMLWKISLYNTLLPGKTRFPLEKDLDLMFDVHEIAASNARADEFKVVLLGDSSVWGYKLNPNETVASIITASKLSVCNGKTVHIYNLGYPSISAFKDIILLQRALVYKPDLIIWNVTLSSLLETQGHIKENVIIKNNLDLAHYLDDKYGLSEISNTMQAPTTVNSTFLDRRNEISRFIRAQLDEIRWQSTGGETVDKSYERLGMDVKANDYFDRYNPAHSPLDWKLLQFNILNAGYKMVNDTPLVILNEPIQIVTGKNSNIRYNKIYPHWVYDQYRELMLTKSKEYDWNYVDLWNIIPPAQFSDTPFHRTPKGELLFSKTLQTIILKSACP